jgi:hypothetical protein
MASLAQIATKIKDLAAAKAPKRTGNLKRKIADFNRPSGMVKESKSKKSRSFEFSIDVSPPGAEYGKYWNDPDVSWQVKKGGKPENINFAQKAYDDAIVQKMINEYIETIREEIANQIVDAIDDIDL